ncbi:alpha-mannosidase [Spirulina major CS-329]|uniref:alpha-mannosidase n=1 Tax=Spirulina TaxID=1154 RepID=UPI00232B23F6|nr:MULTISPECIES: alpha-mannosidase [Spirulina]MDB9496687.1 alpha-mannosidase [Spirulina subsalsa CS-330]MDB9504192.1 alpha-mannosidase [Spirulina major CS-329]
MEQTQSLAPDHARTVIDETIQMLRDRAHLDVQSRWLWHDVDVATVPSSFNPATWNPAALNAKGYIVWEKGRRVRWLWQSFTIPETLTGYPVAGMALRLCLTWWAEDAQIFCNGEPVQAGDLFDSSARVLLTADAQPGEAIAVAIRLVSPNHDIGALMRSHLRYEAPHLSPDHPHLAQALDPGFVADELAVLSHYLRSFDPEQLPHLEQALTPIQWPQDPNPAQWHAQLQHLHQALIPFAADLKTRTFHILGHAHLDMAWLWELAETYDVAERTFQSVLNLQQDFPELTFCHTSPALYQWMETHRPQLFAAIQVAVKAGGWEPVGGMWIEPDVLLPSGESIARQLLYGQRYTAAKFGKITPVAWLTDSFGFCWQLPQLLKQGGIDYFVTQKLHWNDRTKFPHGFFWWEAPDGTRLLTLMSPPNVTGVMDTDPITMTNYSVQWEQQTGLRDVFWLPGVGDHGGGPSRDMLTVSRRWQQSPCFPNVTFTTAAQYLGQLSQQEALPVWADELYLELHRGCYTVHADQKWFNRRCEAALFEAELWSAIASRLDSFTYPHADLEQGWKQVLFNQFHDILPGTSIRPVFEQANPQWEAALATAQGIQQQALAAIASHIPLPPCPIANAQPLLIFNPLNWQRDAVIELPRVGQLYDATGQILPTQVSAAGGAIALIPALPSVGYTLVWLGSDPLPPNAPCPAEPRLENEHLAVIIDPHTGNIQQLWDKQAQREVLRGPGNLLQTFQDQGQYWDAWNIDPAYEQHPLPGPQLERWEWLEWGEVRSRLRVTFRFNESTITQDYILNSHSPRLDIRSRVDWRETHVLLKTAFPLTLIADTVETEMPCGTISRPTRPQTPAEQAKWEIPALRWADLSDGSYGVAVLNDCKYGYDVKPDQLRLSLLRSPVWPDPDCDRHLHHFTYSLYPHSGNWRTARTVHHGYELNQPPAVIPHPGLSGGSLPAQGSFLTLSDDNLVLMAVKQSEDEPHRYLVRLYEAAGQAAAFAPQGLLSWPVGDRVNLLEQPQANPDPTLTPWQIASFQIEPDEIADVPRSPT